MRELLKAERGVTYHIYNRGTNGENIFGEERNYPYFLELWQQKVAPVVDTYAYCLLKDHFHFLLRVKSADVFGKDEQTGNEKLLDPSQQLLSCFNSYAQSISREKNGTGGLFEDPFKIVEVDNDADAKQLVAYIHLNPQKHGVVDDFRKYAHSSYHQLLSSTPGFLKAREVLDWFGSKDRFIKVHDTFQLSQELQNLVDDD